MSRQLNNTKKNSVVILFLILVASIGFPSSAMQIYGYDYEITLHSDYAVINFILGNGFDGHFFTPRANDIIPNLMTFFSISSIQEAEGQLPEAKAQEPSYPIITRGTNFNTIQLDKHNFTTVIGLPTYIERFDGVFIPHEYWEDANQVTFNSADLSFVFDKNACAYTIYNDGRVFNNSTEIIKSDTWVVKFAENGTDNWADVPQQILSCSTEVNDLPDDTFQIKYIKSDSNGIIEHVMNKTVGLGMKHIVSYTNNNPSWNNTKIAFSHILQGAPEHMSIATVINNTYVIPQKYSTNSTIPDDFGLNSTNIDQGQVDIPYTDLIQNGTMITDGFTFHFVDQDKKRVHYDFDQGLDKLWNIRYLENENGTQVYLDYMNDPVILGIGNTTTIDPLLSALGTSANVRRVSVVGSAQSPAGCANNGLGCLVNAEDSTWQYRDNENIAYFNFITYDISSIPSNADVQEILLGHQVSQLFYATINRPSIGMNIYTLNGEDFTALSSQNLIDCIYHNTGSPHSEITPQPSDGLHTRTVPDRLDGRPLDGVTNTNPCGSKHLDGRNSPTAPDHAVFNMVVGTDLITHDDNSDLTSDMESRFLSLGLTKWTYLLCRQGFDMFHADVSGNGNVFESGQTGCAGNVASDGVELDDGGVLDFAGFATSQGQVGNDFFATIDQSSANTFLNVTYVVLTQPSEPIAFTCNPTSPTTVDLDWFVPTDLGGAVFVDGYRIERDSGGGFTDLVSDTGSALTFHTDATVTAGVTFKYRVSALTGFGQGLLSSEVTCGVAGVSDQVTDLLAQNQALGVVALDWTEPPFTGNVVITGYRVDRTTGTPIGVTNNWEWVIHRIDATFPPDNHSIFHNDENIVMSTGASNNIRGEGILFKSFDILDVEGRSLDVLSTYTNDNTQLSYQIKVFDGTYSSAGVNTAGSDFPLDSAIALKGAGLLQSFSSDVGFAETIQGFVIDTSGATLDGTVTVMIINDDDNASANFGTTSINSIEIEGYATWDFGDLVIEVGVPVKSVKSVDTFFIVDPIGNEQSGEITVQSPNGIIFGDGFLTLIDDTGNTNVEFLDSTVAPNINLGYRVFALNSEGSSPSSNIAVIFTAGNPDPPPEPIIVIPTGTTTINVDWENANLNSGVLSGYEIERKLGTGGIFSTITTVSGGATVFEDGVGLFSLQSNQEYCYRVKTITNIGSSGFTNEQCATTFDAPSEVENLLVIALDGSSVNMQFDTPTSDGGSPITGFQIEQKIGAGAFNIVQASNSFNKIRNDTGLPIGTLITYKITPFNQFGGGDVAQASDTTDATPQAPQNFSCSASSATSITLNWDTPETFSPPTGYQIDRRTVGGGFSTLVADTADTATQFVNSALAVDSIFEYRILGHTPEGDTDFTATITCTTLGAPDFPPEDLQGDFTSTVPHQMVLAWDIPDTFGIPIIEFRIERDDGAGYVEIATVSGNTFLFIDQDPDNDVNQKYRIVTVGTEGDSAPSVAIPFTANQISHWHYEMTIDDTGNNKNVGAITGIANFNNTGQVGLGMLFDGSTYITVADESDYDFNNIDSSGFTTYYRGNSTGSSQVLLSKSILIGGIGFNMFIDSTDVLGFRLTNTSTTNEIHILGSTNITDNSLHFLGVGYNGNGTANGVSLMVDGIFETKNVIADTLSGSILNNDALTIGATSNGTSILTGLLDETRIFGSGTLDDATLQAIAEDSITTVIPINATITIAGATFADISRETPLIIMTSGYPLPTINTIDLFNFTATNVNSQVVGLVIDGVSGQFILDPSLFNIMGSLSNYTAITSLTNSEETFPLLSNFDIQVPVFTFTGDFFFQQQRNPTFDVLSFNYTQTIIPFDLDCNFKSTLFENGTTVEFDDVFFVQLLQPVNQLEDVVVACIDPSQPIVDPSAPSFGGINTILSFVSFGDTTGVGNFLQFTNNYGDFFGVGLPFLFVIILAAAFTGRSAPTGILIIAIAIGIMWAMGILVIDPFMWGIILVLVILGLLGGKKFL